MANGTADPERSNPVQLALPGLGTSNVPGPATQPKRLDMLDSASQTTRILILPLFCHESQMSANFIPRQSSAKHLWTATTHIGGRK